MSGSTSPLIQHLLRININSGVFCKEIVQPYGTELGRANHDVVLLLALSRRPSDVDVNSSIETEDETSVVAVED